METDIFALLAFYYVIAYVALYNSYHSSVL